MTYQSRKIASLEDDRKKRLSMNKVKDKDIDPMGVTSSTAANTQAFSNVTSPAAKKQ